MKQPAWLVEALARSPEGLRERLEAAVGEIAEGTEAAEGLLEAACRLLDSVYGRVEDREAAFDLLAADGLFTLACEAAAVSHPDEVAERCRRMGPSGRLGELARQWAERS